MQENNFENQVKELLYNHSESAPNVMSKVFEKRTPLHVFKNRLILNKYKLMVAALFVAVLAFLFNIQANKIESEVPSVAQTELNGTADDYKTSDVRIARDQESIDADDNQNPDNNTNSVVVVSPQSDVEQSIKQPSRSEDVNRTETPINQVDSRLKDMFKRNKDQQDGRYGKDDRGLKSGSGSDKSGEGALGTSKPQTRLVDNTNKTNQDATENVASDKQEGKTLASDVDPSNAKTNSEQANDAKTTIVKTETSKSSSETANTEGDEDFGLPKTKNGKFSVSVNTIVGIGNRSLGDKGDNAIISVRNETETQKLSYGGEMLLNYKLSDNLDVYSGISYFKRREAMQYSHTSQVTDMTVQSKQVIEHHPVFGTREITVYDTSYKTRDVQTQGDASNSYEHYYIPLGLRYTLYHGDRLGLHLAMNGGVEVLTKTKGAILNDQYQEMSLDQDFARTSIGGMCGVGVGLSVLINNRVSLIGEFRVSWFLDPTNGLKYPVNQFDQGYGLMIGLKYDLK